MPTKKPKRSFTRKPPCPPKKVDVAPADSCLNKTAPYLDEIEALASTTLENFNVIEVDRRISLLSRMTLESALREHLIPLKDRAELSLRAITTLEGSKARSELWIKEKDRPIPIDVAAYSVELDETQTRIDTLLDELKERNLLDQAKVALKDLGDKDAVDTKKNSD